MSLDRYLMLLKLQFRRLKTPRWLASWPVVIFIVISAPNASSKRATSAWWVITAKWRGVSPRSFDRAFTFAPLCKRQVTAKRRPWAQHRWRGVRPSWSQAFRAAPYDSNKGTNISDSWELPVQCRAVIPVASASERSREKFPKSITWRTDTSSPRRIASTRDRKKCIPPSRFSGYSMFVTRQAFVNPNLSSFRWINFFLLLGSAERHQLRFSSNSSLPFSLTTACYSGGGWSNCFITDKTGLM